MSKSYKLRLNELQILADDLPKNGIIILRGNLASGKTTLAQILCRNLGFSGEVTSPTFSVMNSYDNKIFHYDIYQTGFANFLKSGLYENLFEDGLHIVEWGDDELENFLKKQELAYCVVEISLGEDYRIYKVSYA